MTKSIEVVLSDTNKGLDGQNYVKLSRKGCTKEQGQINGDKKTITFWKGAELKIKEIWISVSLLLVVAGCASKLNIERLSEENSGTIGYQYSIGGSF